MYSHLQQKAPRKARENLEPGQLAKKVFGRGRGFLRELAHAEAVPIWEEKVLAEKLYKIIGPIPRKGEVSSRKVLGQGRLDELPSTGGEKAVF